MYVLEKRYIGLTTISLKRRIAMHKSAARKGNSRFYSAIRKYGFNKFTWRIIGSCKLDILQYAEIATIEFYDTTNITYGYNISPGGSLISEETKEKFSNDRKGSGNSFYGYTHTYESRLLMKHSTNHNKENNPMFGKNHSEKAKNEMRKKAKLKVGNKNNNYKHHINDMVILKMKMDNKSNQEIANFFKCHRKTIENRLKKLRK